MISLTFFNTLCFLGTPLDRPQTGYVFFLRNDCLGLPFCIHGHAEVVYILVFRWYKIHLGSSYHLVETHIISVSIDMSSFHLFSLFQRWRDIKFLQLKYLQNCSYTNNSMLIKVSKLKLIWNNIKERKSCNNVIKKNLIPIANSYFFNIIHKHCCNSDADSECLKFSKLVVFAATLTELTDILKNLKSINHTFKGDL